MIKRKELTEVEAALKQFPAVAILGPRQVGKTTLVQLLEKKIKQKYLYLDLERNSDVAKLADAETYLEKHQDKCVIIDEVQRMPELFSVLRPLIDAKRTPGRFILLGSASPQLVKGVSESLAGRISYIELPPVTITEALKAKIKMDTHWYRGGFPDALTASTELAFHKWMDNFINTYIERDLNFLFGVSFSTATMRNFWSMLAHTSGGMLNTEMLARSLGVSAPTVTKYLSFLEGAYLLRMLPSWTVNAKKRLVKAPKIYLRDSGILHRLSRVHSMQDLYGHPVVGASWEGYAIQQIISLKPAYLDAYYYRTQHGAECDLVLVKGIKPIAAIEIKLSSTPAVSHGYYTSVSDLKTKDNFIVNRDNDTYTNKDGVMYCSLIDFVKNILPGL